MHTASQRESHRGQSREWSAIFGLFGLTILNSLALFIFYSPLAVQAEGCGDIIYLGESEGEEIRLPIENCDDPFSLLDPSFTLTVTPVYTLSGEVLAETDPVVTDLPTELSLGVDSVEPYLLSEHSLFRREGQDYREVENGIQYDFLISEPGTYTVVATVMTEVGGGLGQGDISPWFKSLREVVLPTAHAQVIELNFGRAALTFIVEEEQISGASSVLFLPGIQASRLYTEGAFGTEDQLWEPNINSDVAQLVMDEDGMSVNEVYTKDVIDTALGLFDIYDSFIAFMDELVSEGTIQNWEPFAYDWRYDVRDIVISGTWYENGVRGLVSRVEDLAEESFTGKVTIIAHSNGGLLAKALLIEYPELAQYIDKIIFVGTPQLGTPTAIAAILHGYDQSKLGGWLLSEETARRATQNMSGAYGLLPGQAYFEKQEDLVVTFDASFSTKLFRDEYGNAINTEEELQALMIGEEGRDEAETIEDALLANERMVERSLQYRREKLDSWMAPEGVEVFEIVGVGLDTESGFEYREFTERVCEDVDFVGKICETETFYKPVPWFSQYGDETVMGVSAEGYIGEKETFFFDLKASRDSQLNYEHSNITGSASVKDLLRSIIAGSLVEPLPRFIGIDKPSYSQKRSVIASHSPVRMSVMDSEGNILGVTDAGLQENIPGGSYRRLAGSSYVIVPQGIPFDILIEGLDEGGMTLTIDTLEGEDQSVTAVVPIEVVSSTTEIRFTASGEGTKGSFSNLQVDEDGDGVVDHEVTLDGEVLPAPPAKATYKDLRDAILALSLRRGEKGDLINMALLAQRFSYRPEKRFDHIEDILLSKIDRTLLRYVKFEKISGAEYETVAVIIKRLKIQ